MKRYAGLLLFGFIVFLLFCGFWWLSFFVANRLGFDAQSTPQYGFSSGIGPMLLTALGMSTIIVSLWHTQNCHEDGCWNLGKHKVNGTPWCNVHAEAARQRENTDDLLREIRDELRKLTAVKE